MEVQQKLEKLFLEYYEEWCLLAYSYLQNKVEAEEVVQNVCVNLLLKKQSAKILNLKAYINTVVKNESLKKIRQIQRFEPLNNLNINTSPSPEESLIIKENNIFIKEAVESLPSPTKKVFELCVFEKQMYQNVADTMGISINTVKYHVKKAYKTLRIQIGDVYIFLIFFCVSLLF